jgi:hypothetical protein
MKSRSFGGKPSPNHIIWEDGTRSSERGQKRFDEGTLREWCRRAGVDYGTSKRVDHDRAPEARTQYRCIFSWEDGAGESFEIDGDEWDIETQRTPRTFLEIDSEGFVRIKGWESEHVLDVTDLRHEGSALVFAAAEIDGTYRLDARKLRSD